VDNLKRIKNHLLGWFFALEIHRTSALENIQWMKANLPPLTGKPSQKIRHDNHLHIEQYDMLSSRSATTSSVFRFIAKLPSETSPLP
jgi:hypothetical protein